MDYAKEGNFMVAGQNIAIDHLVKIIQTIRIEKTTGSLVATRGEGTTYELGTLVFLNGQMVQGKVGRREGWEALNWLLTWGKCRYTLVPSITPDTDRRPKRQFPKRETREQSGIPHVRLVPLGRAQRLHVDREERATENLPGRKPDQLTPEKGKVSPGKSKQANEAVPYRSKSLAYGLQVLSEKGLSRIHKHVFLLVNGSRRAGDLMQLLKLNERELLSLLYDLHKTGIIGVTSPVSL